MPILAILLSLGLLIPFLASAAPHEEVIRDLCAGEKAEGTYVSEMGSAGKVRVNIVCFAENEIGLNIRSVGSDFLNFTLLHLAIDGDYISFLSYTPDDDTAKGVPSHGLVRVKLHLPSLREGLLEGDYRALRIVKPLPLHAKRAAAFPSFFSLAGTGPAVDGEYRVNAPGLDFSFAIETIGNHQRANLVIEGGSGFFLAHGLETASANGIFYVSSGVLDDESGRANLLHLRGRALSENELEVYYLDTQKGLLGPFKATRF